MPLALCIKGFPDYVEIRNGFAVSSPESEPNPELVHLRAVCSRCDRDLRPRAILVMVTALSCSYVSVISYIRAASILQILSNTVMTTVMRGRVGALRSIDQP